MILTRLNLVSVDVVLQTWTVMVTMSWTVTMVALKMLARQHLVFVAVV
jgi:hypothetical protein